MVLKLYDFKDKLPGGIQGLNISVNKYFWLLKYLVSELQFIFVRLTISMPSPRHNIYRDIPVSVVRPGYELRC